MELAQLINQVDVVVVVLRHIGLDLLDLQVEVLVIDVEVLEQEEDGDEEDLVLVELLEEHLLEYLADLHGPNVLEQLLEHAVQLGLVEVYLHLVDLVFRGGVLRLEPGRDRLVLLYDQRDNL